MKNNIIVIFILVIASFLFVQSETTLQADKNIKQVESNKIVDVNIQNIDFEEEESGVAYSAVIEKSAIPLQIFDFFNIF